MTLVQYDSDEEEQEKEEQKDHSEAVQESTTSPIKVQSGAVPKRSNLLRLSKVEAGRNSPAITQDHLQRPNLPGQLASLSEVLPAPKNQSRVQEQPQPSKPADEKATTAGTKTVKHDSHVSAEQGGNPTKRGQRTLFSIETDNGSHAGQPRTCQTDMSYQPMFDHESQAIPVARSSKQVRSIDGSREQSKPGFVHPSDEYKYNPDLVYMSEVSDSVSFRAQAQTAKRRRTQDIPLVMQDIDADERYMDNLRYIQSDERKEEHAPVRFVGTGKHQLSSLLNSAMAQKDSLESSFATQKRNMRDSKAKYGR